MRYLEDYEIGKTYDIGTYRFNKVEMISFGEQYDPQYYHIDLNLAKLSLFGELVASGWHVCSIWMKLYVQAMLTNNMAVEGSPGVDQLRWFVPVKSGDLLIGHVTILHRTPSLSRLNCGILHKQGNFVNQNGDTVMQLLLYSMFRKRSSLLNEKGAH